MALDLNEIIVPYKDFRTDKTPRYTDQMPLLIAEGRIPLSVAGVLERRLHSGLQDWKDNYFFTGDAIAYHPDKKFKIILDSQLLREINLKSRLTLDHALSLEDGMYDNFQGEEFEYKYVKELIGKDLTQADVLQHPIWKAVARNKALLKEYVPEMFKEMKDSFNYNQNMGVYLDSFDYSPKLRALVVDWLESGSRLGGRDYLDYGVGRLVGVAPEALSAHGKVLVKPSLETALNVVNEHLGKGLILRKK